MVDASLLWGGWVGQAYIISLAPHPGGQQQKVPFTTKVRRTSVPAPVVPPTLTPTPTTTTPTPTTPTTPTTTTTPTTPTTPTTTTNTASSSDYY